MWSFRINAVSKIQMRCWNQDSHWRIHLPFSGYLFGNTVHLYDYWHIWKGSNHFSNWLHSSYLATSNILFDPLKWKVFHVGYIIVGLWPYNRSSLLWHNSCQCCTGTSHVFKSKYWYNPLTLYKITLGWTSRNWYSL